MNHLTTDPCGQGNTLTLNAFTRRDLIKHGLAMAAMSVTASTQAQGSLPNLKSGFVAQIFDTSLAQQDVSRDFMVGSKSAWQQLGKNTSSSVAGIHHVPMEFNGSVDDLGKLVAQLASDPQCLALCGTVGQPTAVNVARFLTVQGSSGLRQIAPWLHDNALGSHSYQIFVDHTAQISHAIKSLSSVGIREIGVVYASVQEQQVFAGLMQKLATAQNTRIRPYVAQQGFDDLGRRLDAASPAVMLFMGGTPELAQFAKGVSKINRLRYAIALADVNADTLKQMGTGNAMPVVITQVVPMVNASLPVVREYRQALSKFYDEPPSPLSLSGYLSARATQKILLQLGLQKSRTHLQQVLSQRLALDLGGFVLEHDGVSLQHAYVTQSMLSNDGRVIG